MTGGGNQQLTGKDVRQAAFNAHLFRNDRVGNWGAKTTKPKKTPKSFYPHTFNNREGISTGKGLEFPIVPSRRGYRGGPKANGGNPGAARVILGGRKGRKGFTFRGVAAHPPGLAPGEYGPPHPQPNRFEVVPPNN
jgi:hypothetical protein